MIIAQISDTHIEATSSAEPAGVDRALNLRQCVADINQQDVDVVVHTGDCVHRGDRGAYAHLREILDDLRAPLFIVPGNRDQRGELCSAFEHLASLPPPGDFLHYAIDAFPMRLIALDSVVDGERKGVFCERRRRWLEETLGGEPDRPTILFIHHPPFDIPPHYVGGYRHSNEAAELEALVARHPQVARLLCGHVHCYHRETWGGTVATAMPSVAVDLRKGVDSAIGARPLYCLHATTEDMNLVTQTRVVPSWQAE